MWKTIYCVIVLAIISVQVYDVFSLYTPHNNEPTENSTSSGMDQQCFSSVQHLHFRIVIGAIKGPEGNADPQNLTVPAWAKITFRVYKLAPPNSNNSHANNCESLEAFNVLYLNPRGCQIDWENLTVTQIVTGRKLKVAQIFPLNENNIVTPDAPEKFSFRSFPKSFRFEDVLEMHVPFKLTLTKDTYEDHWEGLHFYNTKHLNSSNQIYEYQPYHAPSTFPTLYSNEPEPEDLSRQRATFQISVARPENQGYATVSNMDVIETVKIGGINGSWVQDNFRQSPPMPLNHVTVKIMWGFENYTIVDENSTKKVTVWSTSQHSISPESVSNNSFYTARTIMKLIDDFEKMLNGTKLPVGKLDVVAIPWFTDHIQPKSILGISAAYEYTHFFQEGNIDDHLQHFYAQQVGFQWLGGMVSVVDALEDSYYCPCHKNGLLQYFVQSITKIDQKKDVVSSSHVETLILDMIGDVFSRPVMESAVGNFYLPKMKWTTSSLRDFYDALQLAIVDQNLTHLLPSIVGNEQQHILTITDIIMPWHRHKYAYPRIYVNQVENDSQAILVSQRDLSEDPSGELWWVPLKISTESGEDLVWLAPNVTGNHSKTATYIWSKKDVINTTKWLVINPNGLGYYRVEYSDLMWRKILDQLILNHAVIETSGKNYLVRNQFTTLPSELKWEEMRKALEITRYLRNERSVLVWTTALEKINALYRKFGQKPEAFGSFQVYFGSLINSVLENIGTSFHSADTDEVVRLREILMEVCAKYEVPVCTQYAVRLMIDWMQNPESNPIETGNFSYQTKQELYCSAIKGDTLIVEHNSHSSSAIFQFILKQLCNDSDTGWRKCDTMGPALACTTNDQLLLDLLNNSKAVHATEYWKQCFADTISLQFSITKPFTMTQVVYEFYMAEVLHGNMSPATFMRYLWILIPNAYVPPELRDKIKQFLERNAKLFQGEENVDHFLLNIDSVQNYDAEYWSDVGVHMVQWLRDSSQG